MRQFRLDINLFIKDLEGKGVVDAVVDTSALVKSTVEFWDDTLHMSEAGYNYLGHEVYRVVHRLVTSMMTEE